MMTVSAPAVGISWAKRLVPLKTVGVVGDTVVIGAEYAYRFTHGGSPRYGCALLR